MDQKLDISTPLKIFEKTARSKHTILYIETRKPANPQTRKPANPQTRKHTWAPPSSALKGLERGLEKSGSGKKNLNSKNNFGS